MAGIIAFDGQIELEALRFYGLPEDAQATSYGGPSLPARTLGLETSWNLRSFGPGATANRGFTVTGTRRGDFADASLDSSSIAFVLDCRVWSTNNVRVTARRQRLDGGPRRGAAGGAGGEAARMKLHVAAGLQQDHCVRI